MAYPQSLQNVIPAVLKEFGMEKKALTYSVILAWPEIVGEKIAQATKAEKLDKGILTIRVKNAVWRYELTMQKQKIMEMIAKEFGEGVVRDIVWKT